MTMGQVVVDTDILSAIMRSDPAVIPKARHYLGDHRRFTFSVITRYEILRGLKAKDAEKQAMAFDRFCQMNSILALADEAIVRAAEIYADLRKRGELISDADILIAASALAKGFGVVTNNERHFRRIIGLKVQNWLG